MSEVEKHGFQTEVKQLLGLLANSLYSNKEVFLRELISNASDAIDKLRFISLEKPEVLGDDPEFRIRVSADKDKKTLTISDNGLGMTRQEAIDHLGTIAKSGTAEFFKNLTGDKSKDSQLIGQFGVGFYSAFVVADKVTVISRSYKSNANEAVCWVSDGSGEFEVSQTTKADRGTEIILSLRDDESEFLEDWTLRSNISKYSDHISVPVQMLETVKPESDDKDDKKEEAEYTEWKQVNDAKALWTKNPKDVTDDEYKEFYKHVSHDYQDPLTWTHNRVEGSQEYISLMYIPQRAPFDMFNREQKHGLKLYVQRVFIMDDADQFMPGYLRFVKGVLDSNDLPLNVSREILQSNKISAQLKKACTKKALQMIAKLAKDEDKTKYETFWTQFGSVLKEGLVEDWENRDEIFSLLRFASTANSGSEQNVSLDDYISRMPEKQKNIYFITAESYQAAAASPYLETLKKKGIEVLLMWERVDEWVMNQVTEYKDKKFINVCSADLDLGDLEDKAEKEEQEAKATENKDLLERIKNALGENVSEVKVSGRLVDTPSCVISEGNAMLTAQMRRLLEASGQKLPEEKFVLEINPDHAIIKKMSAETDEAKFKNWAELVLDQALLADQRGLKDPVAYVKLVNSLLLA
ncbi:MAG: molecular chaperone HtpG [Ruminobacter sp.]|uniref:molecular chaperone HtpG n=1 Tax=Ruminobacter sp. TaxID=2774296 RepID=UPI001B52FFDE|nr:molecular chaperone HtpG [Ruminobacter sp.]MBP3749030.1 molecular chaperone HtpG [Ruminobacter sp.]